MVTDSRAVPRRASRSPDPTSSVSVMQHKSGPWTVIASPATWTSRSSVSCPAAPESEAGRVVFDLSRVTFMDAAGFGAIIGYESTAHQADGSRGWWGPRSRCAGS